MEKQGNDGIRQAVRRNYQKIATGENFINGVMTNPSCCCADSSGDEIKQVPGCGCADPSFSPEKMAALMGYSPDDVSDVPEGANLGLGCGNPVALSKIKAGETIVDLGSGGGFDCFLAARQAGETGRVIGVDMTPEMIHKARRNADKTSLRQVEFRLGEIEHLPVADHSVDKVISNCVINLSPDKPSVFREAYRILKPGGRLFISDILATAPIPDTIRKNLEMVSACIGGAATIEDTRDMLMRAGFSDIKIRTKEESRSVINTWTPGRNAGDYVISAYIEAVKTN